MHFLFDGRQVFRRKGALVGKIIKEAVLNHRTNGDLRRGKQLLHRLGHQVRTGVAQHINTLVILGSDDRHSRVLSEHIRGIDYLIVHLASQGRLRET